MTTNFEIMKVVENMKMGDVFAGVFMNYDGLPDKIQVGKGYIINLEPLYDEEGNENSGTHWCGLVVRETPDGERYGLWFDPLSAPPPQNIDEWVGIPNWELSYNAKNIQGIRSVLCAYYCLAWLQFVLVSQYRTGHLFHDTDKFLEFFEDLDESMHFTKNEFVLKNLFFKNIKKL